MRLPLYKEYGHYSYYLPYSNAKIKRAYFEGHL